MTRLSSRRLGPLLILALVGLAGCSKEDSRPGEREKTGLFPFIEEGRWGLMNRSGKVVLEPQFYLDEDYWGVSGSPNPDDWMKREFVRFFSHILGTPLLDEARDAMGYFAAGAMLVGHALEQGRDGAGRDALGRGFISREGRFTSLSEGLPGMPRTGLSKILWPAQEGMLLVEIGNRWGYVDLKKGEFAIPPHYTSAAPFSEGLAAVRVGNRWGYVDRTDQLVIHPEFEEAGQFSDGLAPVQVGDRWGYVDRAGKLVIEPRYDFAMPFRQGTAFAAEGRKAGLIGRDGTALTPFQFDDIGLSPELDLWQLHASLRYYGVPFSEGLAAVQMGDEWGYVDPRGTLVIPPRYDAALPFIDGMAVVSLGDQFGAIDRSGQYIVTPQYDVLMPPREGMALACRDDLCGFLDRKGQPVIPLRFDWAWSFSDGLAAVEVDSRYGFIDRKGNFIVPPTYAFVHPFFDGLAWVVTEDGQAGYIDRKGNVVGQLRPIRPRPITLSGRITDCDGGTCTATDSVRIEGFNLRPAFTAHAPGGLWGLTVSGSPPIASAHALVPSPFLATGAPWRRAWSGTYEMRIQASAPGPYAIVVSLDPEMTPEERREAALTAVSELAPERDTPGPGAAPESDLVLDEEPGLMEDDGWAAESGDEEAPAPVLPRPSGESLLDLVKAAGPAFGAHAETLGLGPIFRSPGPFTVLVPQDEGLRGSSATTDWLRHHIVARRIRAEDVGGPLSVRSLAGRTLVFHEEGGSLTITDAEGRSARVLMADLVAPNGVVHVIDRPLGGSSANAR